MLYSCGIKKFVDSKYVDIMRVKIIKKKCGFVDWYLKVIEGICKGYNFFFFYEYLYYVVLIGKLGISRVFWIVEKFVVF